MTPHLERKLASLVIRFEEELNGGWTDGHGRKNSVEDQIRRGMSDPEVAAWLDKVRREQNLLRRY